MPSKARKNECTAFEKVQKKQKIMRADALKIRACYEELPNLQGFNQMFAKMYDVTPDTIRRIIRNELHCK